MVVWDSSPPRQAERTIIYLCACLGIGGIVRRLFKNITLWKISFPYTAVLLLIGMLLGVICLSVQSMEETTGVVLNMEPVDLIAIVFPAFIFKTVCQLDAHIFYKSCTQVLIISTLGFTFICLTTGLFMMYVAADRWSLTPAILFGIIISATDTIEMTRVLGQYKNMGSLLIGEEVITCALAIFLFQMLAIKEMGITSEPDIVTITKLLSPYAVGLIAGKLFVYFLSKDQCDFCTHISFSLFVSYMMFYLMQVIMGASGIITLLVFGIVISCNKQYITSDLEHSLVEAWETVYTLIIYVLYIEAGVLFVLACDRYGEGSDIVAIIAAYMICLVSRALMFLGLAPILQRIGYGFPWKSYVFVVWNGLHGTTSILLAFCVMTRNADMGRMADKVIIYVTGLVLMNLLINASTINLTLDILGLTSISVAKISNMNNAVHYVITARDRTINMLKMNRLFADANWSTVRTATKITHPYKTTFGESAVSRIGEGDNEDLVGYRFMTCPACQKEIPNEPTPKEIEEMTREAQMRILKARKVSYWRQYEQGLMSKEGRRVLVGAVEDAMEKNLKRMDIEGLKHTWRPKGCTPLIRNRLVKMLPHTKPKLQPIPSEMRCRLFCYKLINNIWWEYFILLFLVLNMVSIIFDCIYVPRFANATETFLLTISCLFFVIWLAIVIIKIFGMGCYSYMKSVWDFVDVMTVTIIFFYILYVFKFYVEDADPVATYPILMALSASRAIQLLLFLRIGIVLRASIPKFVAYLDKKIDVQLSFGYDVGKGFVTGENEVLKLLPRIVDAKNIYLTLKNEMETARLDVTKEIGILQRNRPSIAITVKTRQSMGTVLHMMKEAAKELKDGGLLDHEEFKKLAEAIYDQQKIIRKRYLSIAPCPPEELLRQVTWLVGDDEAADFLLTHSLMVNLNYEEYLIRENEPPQGIYIIVSGLVRTTYIPRPKKLEALHEIGALPNVDYPTSVVFTEKQEDYILSGNVIGEIGVLTQRTYDATITCESSVQAYFISIDVMKDVMKSTCDMYTGMELRMWKAVSVRLAYIILMTVPAYQSWSQEKILFLLERAFVPQIGSLKSIVLDDLIEAVLLIEGQALDVNSKDIYYGPCYVPRTVRRLTFPKTSDTDIDSELEPKFLIIPVEDVDEEDIIEMLEEGGDATSCRSYCSQHAGMFNGKGSKKKPKRNVFGFKKLDKRRQARLFKTTSSGILVYSASHVLPGNEAALTDAVASFHEAPTSEKTPMPDKLAVLPSPGPSRRARVVENTTEEMIEEELSAINVDRRRESIDWSRRRSKSIDRNPLGYNYRLSYFDYEASFPRNSDYVADRERSSRVRSQSLVMPMDYPEDREDEPTIKHAKSEDLGSESKSIAPRNK